MLDVLILSNNFSSMVVCIFWTILRLLIKSVLKKKCIHQTFCVEGTCHCVHSFKFHSFLMRASIKYIRREGEGEDNQKHTFTCESINFPIQTVYKGSNFGIICAYILYGRPYRK